eukprot:TRINITY_DN44895_c0_g1_i1.p1 TRINITY_DN44895_c0_g1~~TRINITY_DN44895_c0_g1_i1.p1  ORF type:complete len:416 (+),score=60.56 TRINITY_DN44895_c0_g1_i1:87-1334(+)
MALWRPCCIHEPPRLLLLALLSWTAVCTSKADFKTTAAHGPYGRDVAPNVGHRVTGQARLELSGEQGNWGRFRLVDGDSAPGGMKMSAQAMAFELVNEVQDPIAKSSRQADVASSLELRTSQLQNLSEVDNLHDRPTADMSTGAAQDLPLLECLTASGSDEQHLSCLAGTSLLLNVILFAVLLCLCCLPEDERDECRDFAESVSALDEPLPWRISSPPPTQESQESETLQRVERLALADLAILACKSASKTGAESSLLEGLASAFKSTPLRQIAVAPAVMTSNADGSLSSRLEAWRRGFLGWWEDSEEFWSWCKLGRPEPKGSIPLAGISGLTLQTTREEGKVEVKHEAQGYEASMLFDFGGAPEAQKWFDALREVLLQLGLREIPAREDRGLPPRIPLSRGARGGGPVPGRSDS